MRDVRVNLPAAMSGKWIERLATNGEKVIAASDSASIDIDAIPPLTPFYFELLSQSDPH